MEVEFVGRVMWFEDRIWSVEFNHSSLFSFFHGLACSKTAGGALSYPLEFTPHDGSLGRRM
jgi:hypothetical protein